jgi:hypothetical protein
MHAYRRARVAHIRAQSRTRPRIARARPAALAPLACCPERWHSARILRGAVHEWAGAGCWWWTGGGW